MRARELLALLADDFEARLRRAVLRREGISPLSLRAMFISRKAILREACHMVLDDRMASGASFDEGKFRELMKEAEG